MREHTIRIAGWTIKFAPAKRGPLRPTIVHTVCGERFRSQKAFDAHLPCAKADAQNAMLLELADHNKRHPQN